MLYLIYENEMSGNFEIQINGKTIRFSNVDVVNVVDTGMVYPSMKSVQEKELKECNIKFEYNCTEDGCNFDNCLTAVRQSAELKSRGLKDTTAIVIEALKNNQELFTVKEVGGFILQASGKGQVAITNGPPTTFQSDDTRRYGFLDLTETRRRFIHQYELHKMKAWNVGQIAIVGSAGIATGGFGMLFLLRSLKKI